ncbi:MAG: ATP-dependent RNA helicase, partial [Treponema sp.]|nr:ATP-dependent RNA helicase [Treponema sp.]
GKILLKGGELLTGEKVELICKLTKTLNLLPINEKDWPRGMNVQLGKDDGTQKLIANIDYVLRVTMAKAKSREYGFICLYTDGKGTYWFKVSRGFATALNESLSSLETLIDEATVSLSPAQKEKVNIVYRVLNGLYE